MRLTYKKLASIVSDKLKSLEISHNNIEAINPRFRGQDLEAGAACIIYRLSQGEAVCTMYSFQFIKEIREIVAGKYVIKIQQQNRFTISDSTIFFENL